MDNKHNQDEGIAGALTDIDNRKKELDAVEDKVMKILDEHIKNKKEEKKDKLK